MTCSICNNIAVERLKKGVVQYYQCTNCLVLFCGPTSQEGLVGGGAEMERNQQQNYLRIERIAELTRGIKKEDLHLLDAGCGHALLINDFKAAGYHNVDGWDAYNEEYSRLPEKGKYDVITCVEMIEHCSSGYHEITVMNRSLKKGGIAYIETGFLNAAWEDGLSNEDNPYINPLAGHSTIWTHHAMDIAFLQRGFSIFQKVNRHCHVYVKI